MISNLINFRTFNLILLSSLILYSCTTKLQSFKPNLTQQVNIDDNFTIEGKFKIKLNKDIQSGYFIISKKDNSVSLMIGKNYLLPEKKFMYQVNDYLNLSKISNLQIEKNEERISDGKLEIRTLLQALLGNLPPKKGNNWKLSYTQEFQILEELKFPKRVEFIYKSAYLEIILKRVIKE